MSRPIHPSMPWWLGLLVILGVIAYGTTLYLLAVAVQGLPR